MLDKFDLMKTVVYDNKVLKSYYYKQPELELTVAQKKIILYLISRIDKDSTEFKTEAISLIDICNLFGISDRGGRQREQLRDVLKDLGKKCFFLVNKDGNDELFRWVDRIIISPSNQMVYIKLYEGLRPYYLELAERCFTIFQLGYTINFKSKYSFVLYEQIKQRANMKKFVIPLDEVKMWICNNYERYTDIRRIVLNTAIEEINIHSDIFVSYKPIKEGKMVTKIEFTVRNKNKNELLIVDDWKKLSNSVSINEPEANIPDENLLDNINEVIKTEEL